MFKNATAMWLIPVFFASGIASAQISAPVIQKSEPARIALPGYTSVFEGYTPYSDEKLLDWKEANRQVARRGGWREYAKEAQEPEPKRGPLTPTPSQTLDRAVPKSKPSEQKP